MTAVFAENPPAPGTPEWAQTVSASKIPALLGLSQFETPYSLWAQATGRSEGVAPDPEIIDRGNVVEPGLLNWVGGHLPEGQRVSPGGTFYVSRNPAHTATPDGIVWDKDNHLVALVECKTAANGKEWGQPGTAEIPPAYLAQCAWQMFVTGARLVYVPALVNPGIRLNLWIVEWEDVADQMPALVRAADAWLAHVRDDTPPDFDGHEVTWAAARDVHRHEHPDIDPDGITALDAWDAHELVAAKAAKKAADARLNQAQAVALTAAAGARTLVDESGAVIARVTARRTKTGEPGRPYLTYA